jgi:type IV pilus assembly protein PilY1
MTDGYYGDSTGSVGNADGASNFTTPAKPDGTTEHWTTAPFSDTFSNTLADIAWYYWARDLHGDQTNNKVPGTTNDPAWWQHMTTFTIGLGVSGTISKDIAFAAARATPTGTGTNINWPRGSSNQIDDLLHAAVNGHGDFFAAQNPQEFADGMASIINSVQSSAAASSKLARNNSGEKNIAKVTTSTLVYEVKNEPGWFGRVFAYRVCTKAEAASGSNGCANKENQIKSPAVWEASEKIGAHGARNILSAKRDEASLAATTTTTTGIEFKWSSLDATQQGKIEHLPFNGQDVLN